MEINNNFKSLHSEEEKIRLRNINIIEDDYRLSKHLSSIHNSMDIISFIAKNNENYKPEELTIMRLGIRNFNSVASSIKLGLSGYYQSAISQVREVFETVMLLDYFSSFPDEIDAWTKANKKERLDRFRPVLIRQKLDKRDNFQEKKRNKAYKLFSELAAHPTASGFVLFSPNNLSNVGPFFNEKYLKVWIEELAKLVSFGGVIFVSYFEDNDNFSDAINHYNAKIKLWFSECMK